ncbi:MAG: heavy-metal-associated domain-containing protein, partial [Desulfobacterales bacterium]
MAEQIIILPITGMTCASCALNIERGVNKLEGVQHVNVNFAAEQATVSFDPKQQKIEDIVQKVVDSGYDVTTAKAEFPVTGMTCANCAMNIERALNKKTPGVIRASVNFASERVSVEYIPVVVTVDNIIAAIKKAGFNAILPDDAIAEEDVEQKARDAEIKDQTT